MKSKTKRSSEVMEGDVVSKECALCKRSDDCSEKFGEKVTLDEHGLTVHYFCLLMSSGIFQRGEEHEGIHGFLVEDIKKEIRRSSKLKCKGCKKNGASVGCCDKKCRQMVHLPCGREMEFIFQFTDLFPSFCKKHRPTQNSAIPNLPLSCSICLEFIDPVLSYSVLKCPACHGSWFHRDCVQHQAHSAALFFFRCTLCNNKDQFQQEMLRMGINIPERDASWELEENAYGDLLQVYQHCDAVKCSCDEGRSYSAQSGFFAIVRCKFCGSSGTHRKCSSLKHYENNWSCDDCKFAVEGTALSTVQNHVKSPLAERQEKKRLIKRCLSDLHTSLISKRCRLEESPPEILRDLATQILSQQVTTVLVKDDNVYEAALQVLRQSNFNPCHTLSVSFSKRRNNEKLNNNAYFLSFLVQKLQTSNIFEGSCRSKNLALNSQALRNDLYYEVGSLLALSLVHGGPALSFFSPALYHSLFHYPEDYKLTIEDLGDVALTKKVQMIAQSASLKELKKAMRDAAEYLQVAGCMQHITKLSDKTLLVEDILNFHLILRMQLPLQRFREGLQTLGVFERVQACPEAFFPVFCGPEEVMTADMMFSIFTVWYSDKDEQKADEYTTLTFWRTYLLECEGGRCAASLDDILTFATGSSVLPAIGFDPPPSLSFFIPVEPSCAFPQSLIETNHLILPLSPSYDLFKKLLDYAVCQVSVMQAL